MFHARLDAVAAVRARTLRAPGRRARLIADAAPAAHSDGLDALLIKADCNLTFGRANASKASTRPAGRTPRASSHAMRMQAGLRTRKALAPPVVLHSIRVLRVEQRRPVRTRMHENRHPSSDPSFARGHLSDLATTTTTTTTISKRATRRQAISPTPSHLHSRNDGSVGARVLRRRMSVCGVQTPKDLESPLRSTSERVYEPNACPSRTSVTGRPALLTTHTPSRLERRKVRSAVATDATHESRPSTWNETSAPREQQAVADLGEVDHHLLLPAARRRAERP